MALRRDKYLNACAVKACGEQRRAITASVKDKSMSVADVKVNMSKAIATAAKLTAESKKINIALASILNISSDLKKFSDESSQVYKEDKGHGSDSAIPAPQKADPVGADATGGTAPMDPEKAPPLDVKDKAEGAPTGADGAIEGGTVASQKKKAGGESAKQAEGKTQSSGDALADPKTSSQRVQAKKLYVKAIALVKESSKETDTGKKASLARRAFILERHADRLVANKVVKKTAGEKPGIQDGTGPYGMNGNNSGAGKQKGTCTDVTKEKGKKSSTGKEAQADKTVFSARDRVLLADGTIATISSVTGDKMVVSIAGQDKEVVSSTVKKITAYNKEACDTKDKKDKKKEKLMSVKDKIKSAIGKIRSSKKKAMDVDGDEPAVAIEGEVEVITDANANANAPAPIAESPSETTVSKSEVKVIDFVEGEGYVVNKSETEVMSFGEDRSAAENYVQAMLKEGTQQQDTVIDSADHAKAEGSEDITKKLKGLDQKGKDYGKTTREEKVNPDTSMIGKASKKTGTALNKDAPTDSASLKKPGGTETIVQKIKGLTQKAKGYSSTKPDQKINPELSVFAKKNKVLEASAKKQATRLMELESGLLVDRAVKVGAVDEADRSEQQKILAELYKTGPSEFKAFARLITQMEKNGSKSTGVSRAHKKIANSMGNKNPVVVTASNGTGSNTLEEGNFFDD